MLGVHPADPQGLPNARVAAAAIRTNRRATPRRSAPSSRRTNTDVAERRLNHGLLSQRLAPRPKAPCIKMNNRRQNHKRRTKMQRCGSDVERALMMAPPVMGVTRVLRQPFLRKRNATPAGGLRLRKPNPEFDFRCNRDTTAKRHDRHSKVRCLTALCGSLCLTPLSCTRTLA